MPINTITWDDELRAEAKLNKIILGIRQGLPQAIFYGMRTPLVDAIKRQTKVVTGRTIKSFNALQFGTGYQGVTVCKFLNGESAVLNELGVKAIGYTASDGSFTNAYKKYENGKFISFDKNPDLKSWADKLGLKFKKGVKVGTPSTTHWGKGDNKWLTEAVWDVRNGTDTEENLRIEIQKMLNSIKK